MMKNVGLARAVRALGGSVTRKRLKKFHNDERGVFIVLALVLVIITYIAIGFAVDMARHEALRSRLQSTLDRAVLAAASLTNTQDDTIVVNSYFSTSGFDPSIVEVTSSSLIGKSTVTASARAPMRTTFMSWSGVDFLGAVASGSAGESVSDIEISLVLDKSGSMDRAVSDDDSTKKIVVLKEAATAFTEKLFPETQPEESRIFLTIVPYANSVNLGANVMATINKTNENTSQNCIDLDDLDFINTVSVAGVPSTMQTDGVAIRLTPNQPYQRAGFMDYLSDVADSPSDNSFSNSAPGGVGSRACDTTASSQVAPFLSDYTGMNAIIDGLTAGGYTSTDIAAKWGLAFLDPSMRSSITTLSGTQSGDYDIEDGLSTRPADYTFDDPDIPASEQTMKVLILMTDGDHTYNQQFRGFFHDSAVNSNSWVWANSDWSRVYFEVPELTTNSPTTVRLGDGDATANEQFYVWRTGGSAPSSSSARWINRTTAQLTSDGVTKRSWDTVFRKYKAQYFAFGVAQMLATVSTSNPSANGTYARLTQLIGANSNVDVPGADGTQYYIRSETGPFPGVSTLQQYQGVDSTTLVVNGTFGNVTYVNNRTVSPALPSLNVAPYSTTKFPYGMIDNPGTVTKDQRLWQVCDLAKDKNIIVYSIGFATTDRANTVLEKCASIITYLDSDNVEQTRTLFFSADTADELKNAFSDIADEIGKLALTQ